MVEQKKFSWKSLLGLSVLLFLLYGIFNVFAAIKVPTALHSMGSGAMGGLIVSNSADAKVLGQDLMSLPTTNQALNDYLVAYMDTMCMMMMGFGIFQVAIVWFALRKRQLWALWTLALADLSFIPYWMNIAQTYSKYGISNGEVWAAFGSFFYVVIVAVVVATIAGYWDIKKATK